MALPQAVSKGVASSFVGAPSFGLAQMAGRLVEISGERAKANLTVAFGLVLEAQRRRQLVAWVTLEKSSFYPPDAAESGVSLAHLAVVRVADVRAATRASVTLTRSGGFDLVVVDLGAEAERQRLSNPLLTKLVGLARKNKTAVVILTDKSERASSVSSLISLRACAQRDKDVPFKLEVAIVKDKRRGPGRRYHEDCGVPAGLR